MKAKHKMNQPTIPTKGPTMDELPPPTEVRMFCRGPAVSIQEFTEINLDAASPLVFAINQKRTYIGHAIASIKCRTDRGLQELPHAFQFPIIATSIAEAFAKYETARFDAFQVEMSNLRKQALQQGATLDQLPRESGKK